MTAQQQAASFVDKFNDVILFPLIALLSALALLLFLYGCAEYIKNAANDEGREEGVRHITWGIIGLIVMTSAWAILRVATGTLGLSDELECVNNPTKSGCTTKLQIDPAALEIK
jgi:cell division protein FtsW (lipid II flippase)